MPDIPWWFNLLKECSPSILTVICITLVLIYFFHIKRKNESLDNVKSNYEILQGMKKKYGQVTLYPNSINTLKGSEYKYTYDCTLHINAVEIFPDGFSMTLTTSEDFKIGFGKSSEEKSVFRKPKHSLYLNSDVFKTTRYSLNGINSFDFDVCSNQKILDLEIKIDFGSRVIVSKVFLKP